MLKKPIHNPKMKLQNKLKILWRPELALIQELNSMPKYKQVGKDTVINKIIERTEYPEGKKGRISLEELSRQVSNVLFERDYNDVSATLKEYYKGELKKKIDLEEDPQKRIELLMEQTKKRENASAVGFKKKRRRRRRF